jgi:putative flippase GtrA
LTGRYGEYRQQVLEPACRLDVGRGHCAQSPGELEASTRVFANMTRPRCNGVAAQFVSFAGMGAIGTLAHYIALLALVVLLGADPVFASAFGYCTGGVVNYLLTYRFTFRSRQPHFSSGIKFAAIATAGFGINWALMSIATREMHLHFIAAQAFTTAAVLGWNFVGNRLWTFRNLPS